METQAAVTAEQVKHALEGVAGQPEEALRELERLYAEDVVFQDPLQTLSGKAALMAMNRRLLQRYRTLRFAVDSAVQSEDQIFLTWKMHLCASIEVPGASHLRLAHGRVVAHRDYWDLLGAFVDQIPVARVLYHAILKRFA